MQDVVNRNFRIYLKKNMHTLSFEVPAPPSLPRLAVPIQQLKCLYLTKLRTLNVAKLVLECILLVFAHFCRFFINGPRAMH